MNAEETTQYINSQYYFPYRTAWMKVHEFWQKFGLSGEQRERLNTFLSTALPTQWDRLIIVNQFLQEQFYYYLPEKIMYHYLAQATWSSIDAIEAKAHVDTILHLSEKSANEFRESNEGIETGPYEESGKSEDVSYELLKAAFFDVLFATGEAQYFTNIVGNLTEERIDMPAVIGMDSVRLAIFWLNNR